MRGIHFIDTNILLYAAFNDGGAKHRAARELLGQTLRGAELAVSAQVLGEFFVNALRKGIARESAEGIIERFIADFFVAPVTDAVVRGALRIGRRYGFSYWDSLIAAAALEAGCGTLYTEDLQHGQVIAGSLAVVNPFSA